MYVSDEAEIEAVRRVLETGRLYRYQPGESGECDQFEREFAEQIDIEHAVLVSSGTNALLASLVALGVSDGDEVLVPAYTYVATAAAVRLAGARPIVVNIDERLGLSPEDARAKITARTKAIVAVHMDGLSADLPALARLAREHELKLIEDAAQAIGGSCLGRRLGTWGDAGAFSLNQSKLISCGEGGIAVCRERETFERLYCLQDLAVRYSPTRKHVFAKPPKLLGMSMRVSEIQGAIMRVQLKRLEPLLAALRARKNVFVEELSGIPGMELVFGACREGDCGSSVHLSFGDPRRAADAAKRLLAREIVAIPPTLRPAHAAWKWLADVDPEAAPFAPMDLLPSIGILTRILKYDVDPKLSLVETRTKARLMRELLVQCTAGVERII